MPFYITGFSTFAAFLVGIWTLPTRMSTVKYMIGGAAIGIVGSYAYWRYNMMQYYDILNHLVQIVAVSRF
jgi:hypothetical protein